MIGETSDLFSAFALERERTPLDTWIDAMVTSLVDSGWAAARIELFVAGIAVRADAGDVQRLVSEAIVVPLVVRDERLGAIAAVATNPDPVAVRMLHTFAEVFARAVDMERRILRVENEAARSAVIARIGESIRRSLDREEILQAVARDVRAAFGCASCTMYLRDQRSPAMARIIAAEESVATTGAHPEQIAIDGTLLDGCFGRGGTVRIESTESPLDAERLAPFRAQAMLMVPFVVDGRIDAAIAVQYARPHAFEDSDLPLMRSIAMQVGLALANSRLYERERAARRRAEDIERNVRVLKNTRSVPQILHLLLNMIAQEFSLAGSAWELTARDLVCRVIVPREDGSGPTVGATANPVLAILENKSEQDVIAISTRGESAWIPVIGKRGGFALPLRIENRLFGMLAFDGMSRSADEREDRDAYLRTVAAHGALALANARAFEAEHRFAAESAAISEAGRTILAHNELEPLAHAMAQYALDLSGSATVCLYLARAGTLQRIGCAAPGGVCQFPSTLALSDPLVVSAIDHAQSASITLGRAPVAVVPLRAGIGAQPVGVFVCARGGSGTRTFDAGELALLEALGALVALGLRNVELYSALAENNDFKDDLLAMFTHDFRGPLTVIQGYTELLLEDDLGAARANVETIYAQSMRLAKLADDALVLARTQAAGFSLTQTSADLSEFVRECLDQHDLAAERIVYTSGEQAIPVSIDRTRLRQVLDNVIGNALKYSGGEVRVEVRVHASDAVIRVADSGIGIAAADIERIFARFGRGSNARTLGIAGTGVGLYIAKKIVDVHGGRISVSSKENEGSVFEVVLPIAVPLRPLAG